MRRALAVLLPLFLLAAEAEAGRPSPLATVLDRARAARELDAVLDQVRATVRQGKTPVIVFDIDDTLIKWEKKGGVKTTSWTPMPGAVPYLRALAGAGAHIVYLTARSEFDERGVSQRPEALGVLRTAGFPLGGPHELMMNPYRDVPSVKPKGEARPRILAKGIPLAFFDNDLSNVRLFRRQYRGARVFRVGDHSSASDPEPQRGVDGIRAVADMAGFHDHRFTTAGPRRAARPRAGALRRHQMRRAMKTARRNR